MISDFPEPTWTTASVIGSNNYKFVSTPTKISHNIKQYQCDAGRVTAPPVLEVREASVLAADAAIILSEN